LPTLSEVVALSDSTGMSREALGENSGSSRFDTANGTNQSSLSLSPQKLRAEREWSGAIAALEELLDHYLNHDTATPTIHLDQPEAQCGFVLAGPSPVLSAPVAKQLSNWTLAAPSAHAPHWVGFQLLPAAEALPVNHLANPVLPLLPGDPLASEPFCLVFTPWFSAVLVLGEDLQGNPAFLFSFAPDVVQRSWDAVRPRILLMSSHQVDFLDELAAQFPPVTPDFKAVMQFSRLLLKHLPDPVIEESKASEPQPPVAAEVVHTVAETSSFDVELVKALAHEVRTPLTTIRTLTRSLLKRVDLPADVLRRLGIIDRECSEQIDRFGLIFKAVEIESATHHSASMSLIRTSLSDVFQQSIPRWQQQASQRQMTLTVDLPQEMPAVVSDPTVLDQALTSLIERFTRNLPAGSHIQVEVAPAGSQLKVQLQSQLDEACNGKESDNPFSSWKSSAKSIGQMLMFQPETGSLSLNLAVTKNLFQAIGGKLIVKQRPQQGEVMTVYLPLEVGDICLLDSKKIITI
jgi:signal transduction histidine kinase